MGNALVAGKRQKQRFSVAITTDQYQKLIHNTLQDPDRARRFVASITSAVAVNPQLQDCDAGSILAGALLGESLNLSPSPQLGQYYLVPFEVTVKDEAGRTVYQKDENGNDTRIKLTEKKAQFILGYSGYLQLAIRSGQYKDIDVMEIKQGEYRGKDKETGKPVFSFIEDDDAREELPTVGYMAYYEYLNGFRKVIYWSKDKMVKHADKYSPAFSKDATKGKYPKVSFEDYEAGNYDPKDEWLYSSFWYKDFDAMAKKTLLRQLISKWGIMSIDMQTALAKDDSLAMAGDAGIDTENVVEVDPADIKPEFDGVAKQVDLDSL